MSKSDRIPTGVGLTALGVAMVRAQESRRPNRLFDDPWAQAFLDAAGDVFAKERRAATGTANVARWGAVFSAHAVLRTRFFDDHLLSAAGVGIQQVVLLAAGLDTRAFRLPWPDQVRLYELDLPEVLAFKDKVLSSAGAQPRCRRSTVAVDLRHSWSAPLLDAGLNPSQPTAWLAEGLLIYLCASDAATLLRSVTGLSAPDSRLAIEDEELGTQEMRDQAQDTPAMQQYSQMWKGGLPDAPAWLQRHSWRTCLHGRADVALNYGRPAQHEGGTGGFLTAIYDRTTRRCQQGKDQRDGRPD